MIPVPLLVCGTPLRGDDGAGAAAVRELPERAAALADVRFVGQLDADLLVSPGMEPCIVVDTVVGVPPGSLISLPLADVAEVGIGRLPHSSHSLGIGRAVRLAETILGRPLEGRFVGIGGVEFRSEAPLSAAVRDALPAFGAAIAEAIASVAQAPAGRG